MSDFGGRMAQQRKIPETLFGEIFTRSASGESTRSIAAWLGEAHGIAVHHSAVAAMVKDARAERRETARAIVEEKLGSAEGLSADIDGIIELRKEAADVRRMALLRVNEEASPRNISAWACAAKEYRETSKLALEIAGLAKPEDTVANELDRAAEQVTSRIAQLAARLGAGAAPSGASTDEEGSGSTSLRLAFLGSPQAAGAEGRLAHVAPSRRPRFRQDPHAGRVGAGPCPAPWLQQAGAHRRYRWRRQGHLGGGREWHSRDVPALVLPEV